MDCDEILHCIECFRAEGRVWGLGANGGGPKCSLPNQTHPFLPHGNYTLFVLDPEHCPEPCPTSTVDQPAPRDVAKCAALGACDGACQWTIFGLGIGAAIFFVLLLAVSMYGWRSRKDTQRLSRRVKVTIEEPSMESEL